MPVPLIARIPRLGILSGRDVRAPQPHQVPAFVGVAAHLRAWSTAHALLKLPDRRFTRAAKGRQVHGAVGVAAGTFDFEIPETCIERVADRRGRLRHIPACDSSRHRRRRRRP